MGDIGNIWDNGKENGSYYFGFRRLFTIHLTMNLFERAPGQGRSAGMDNDVHLCKKPSLNI